MILLVAENVLLALTWCLTSFHPSGVSSTVFVSEGVLFFTHTHTEVETYWCQGANGMFNDPDHCTGCLCGIRQWGPVSPREGLLDVHSFPP